MTDLLAFCAFFIVGLMIGMITFQFSNFSFGIGNAAGLLFAGIMLGFLRANHPTFGYIPQGALNMVKEFGLMVFMAGVGLSAGSGIGNGLGRGRLANVGFRTYRQPRYRWCSVSCSALTCCA